MERHTLITGRSGSGKSCLMQLLCYDLQRRSQKNKNYALIVLDPHGDLAKSVLSFALNEDKERVVYISSSINKEADTPDTYTAVINPFDCDGKDDTINILSQELADAFIELLADTQSNFTPQMLAILIPCIATVLRSPNPCIDTLKRFFLDGLNADLVELGKLSPNAQHREFFLNDFHVHEYAITKRSIRTKLTYFLGDQNLANMLIGKSTIDLEKCLNEGKVIIINLPKGSGKFTSSVFGRLMIAYIHSIFLRRDGLAKNKRKKAYFILDELATLMTNSLASNLSEARKFGLSMILATQSIKQIDNVQIRKTIMVNTGIKAISQTDYEDRNLFAKEAGIRIEELENLKPLHFFIKTDNIKTPFLFKVPFLGSQYFLNEVDRKNLLKWIVYNSGMYVKVPPLDTISTAQANNSVKMKTDFQKSKGKKGKDFFDSDLKPAF